MFIGIDGGATKTRAVVVDPRRGRLGAGQAGPSNYQVVGPETAVENLVEALAQALEAARVCSSQVEAWGAGLAGLDAETDVPVIRAMMAQVSRRSRLTGSWLAVNDGVAAWAGALEGRPGGVVLSGSGAIALAVNAQGHSARADGWGHWLGDEGSGFDIGRQGLRAALRALDGRGPETALTARMAAVFGHPTEGGGAQWLAHLNRDPVQAHRDITRFAQEVIRVAHGGDPVAGQILEGAGQALARSVVAALRRVQWTRRPRVASLGSILGHAPQVCSALERALRAALPGACLVQPAMSPAEGAALLARSPDLVPVDRIRVTAR